MSGIESEYENISYLVKLEHLGRYYQIISVASNISFSGSQIIQTLLND